jgi:hypothetical protein
VVTSKDEELITLRCCLSTVLGASKRFFRSIGLFLNPGGFLSLQLHHVDVSVWLDLAILSVLDTSVKKVVLGTNPAERVT